MRSSSHHCVVAASSSSRRSRVSLVRTVRGAVRAPGSGLEAKGHVGAAALAATGKAPGAPAAWELQRLQRGHQRGRAASSSRLYLILG